MDSSREMFGLQYVLEIISMVSNERDRDRCLVFNRSERGMLDLH